MTRRTLAFGAVLVLAAGLRFWGLGFGLPHTGARPDEAQIAKTAVDFLGGNLNPGFFNYPTLFMYVVGASYAGYCAAGMAAGRVASLAACAAAWPSAWEPFFLMARVLSALAGTATVWIAYRLGLRLFDGTTGLAAALFLACAFLHVRDSHFGVTDVAMAALAAAAVLATADAHDRPALRRFAGAGALAGLAASTKYNALLLAVLPVVSQLIDGAERRRDPVLRWRIPAFLIAMGVGFVAGSPYSILDPARFWADASSEAAHLSGGHGILLGSGWRYHAAFTLWHGLTWPLLSAAVVGIVWMSRTQPRRAALLLAFPVAYYAVAGRGMTVFARYMIPVVPFLCVAAGYAVSRISSFAAGRMDAKLAAIAWTGVLVLPSLSKSVALDRLLARTDSRVLAAEWVAVSVPTGSSVYVGGGQYGAPDLSRRGSPAPYSLVTFDESRSAFVTSAGSTTPAPEWIVLQESPLQVYSRVPDPVRQQLSRYTLRQSFRAFEPRVTHAYDQQDAWFLPMDGFAGVGRPGPNVSVYRRRD